MNKLLIAACALLALPGAALAQPRGGGAHGGSGSHGGGGHGAPSGRSGGGFRGGGSFSAGVGVRGGGVRAFAAGPVGRFGVRDVAAWRGGFWWHGYRGSRFGWWWFTDGFWYWYDAPLYPYPDFVGDYYVPSQAYAPPGRVWYYCYSPAGYYPYVPACPSGWRVVPATDGPDDY